MHVATVPVDVQLPAGCEPSAIFNFNLNDWLINFHFHSIPLSFPPSAAGLYHPSFAFASKQASGEYLDRTFVDMMWYKVGGYMLGVCGANVVECLYFNNFRFVMSCCLQCFALWLLLKLKYNVLFQVWMGMCHLALPHTFNWFISLTFFCPEFLSLIFLWCFINSFTSLSSIGTEHTTSSTNPYTQDADLVWFKEPFSFFNEVISAKQAGWKGEGTAETEFNLDIRKFSGSSLPDAYFSDDGQRGIRYAPYFANSGFYYMHSRSTKILFNFTL